MLLRVAVLRRFASIFPASSIPTLISNAPFKERSLSRRNLEAKRLKKAPERPSFPGIETF
jgi:hypothetical protein